MYEALLYTVQFICIYIVLFIYIGFLLYGTLSLKKVGTQYKVSEASDGQIARAKKILLASEMMFLLNFWQIGWQSNFKSLAFLQEILHREIGNIYRRRNN